MDIVVYGRPNCIQCRYTTRELDNLGIGYIYVDIDADPDAREAVEETGITTLPVVVTADGVFGGFKPDRLRALASRSSR